MIRIKSPQDLGAAVTFFVIGAGGVWFGREYEVGTASAMGPGYMPLMLSLGLILFGAIAVFRAVTIEGPPLAMPKWRPVIFILATVLLFSAVIRNAGLLPTAFLVIVFAALASSESRWKETLLLATGLAVFCVLVFIYGLGQTIPIIGSD